MPRHGRVAILTVALLAVTLAPLCEPHADATSSTSSARQGTAPGLAGTLMLTGRMSSRMSLTMTGAFSLGHALSLDWSFPLVTAVHIEGYSQRIDSLSFAFDVPPDSSSDLAVGDHIVRRYHWRAPPANTVIHLLEKLEVSVTTTLSPLRSDALYPLAEVSTGSFPARYVRLTRMVRLPPAAHSLLVRLIRGRTTEQDVVVTVANWVATHVHYGGASGLRNATAAWVFSHGEGTCRGYANLMAGLLRALGIPVQIVSGWVDGGAIDLPVTNHVREAIQWATPGSQGELHTWLNIYFPGSGWVPFDPQREKYFVDPHHIAFLTSLDAGNLHLDAWSAQASSGKRPTGRPLDTGTISIAPASGVGSRVTVRSQDDFHLALKTVQRDVSNVLLLSRVVARGAPSVTQPQR